MSEIQEQKHEVFNILSLAAVSHFFLSSVRPFVRSSVRSLARPFVSSCETYKIAFTDFFSPSKYSAIFMSKVHQCISAAIISLDKERIDTQSIVV